MFNVSVEARRTWSRSPPRSRVARQRYPMLDEANAAGWVRCWNRRIHALHWLQSGRQQHLCAHPPFRQGVTKEVLARLVIAPLICG